jgi:AhpD family alkylhydroperoxidase
MARVSLVEYDQAPPMVKELYDKNTDKNGRILNLWKAMGNLPYIGLNYQRMGNSILRGEGLNPALRELAILRVGDLARSAYEFTAHTAIGLRAGLSLKKINEIHSWKISKEFTDAERAVLAYTDEVAVTIQVKDETFNNLKKHLTDQNIVELTAAIGYYGMTCRILEALKIDMEAT